MPLPNEDRFLGTLLGLAIGDALGMPVAGLDAATIAARHGRIDRFLPGGAVAAAAVPGGEVTDDTETVLSIVEGLTAGQGRFDPDTIGPRLVYLARGESRRWFPPATLAALDRAGDTLDFAVPLDEDAAAPADVAVRGVPIGLLHAIGAFDPASLRADVEQAVRLTHGGTTAIAAAEAVAHAVRLAARAETIPPDLPGLVAAALAPGSMADTLSALQHRLDRDGDWEALIAATAGADGAFRVVPLALAAAVRAARFEDAVADAIAAGGETDTFGAIAGAIAGARFGSAGIPQRLIDGLGSRIYVSLAAPWFYKAAQRRAGILIDLTPRLGGPRPPLPPRF